MQGKDSRKLRETTVTHKIPCRMIWAHRSLTGILKTRTSLSRIARKPTTLVVGVCQDNACRGKKPPFAPAPSHGGRKEDLVDKSSSPQDFLRIRILFLFGLDPRDPLQSPLSLARIQKVACQTAGCFRGIYRAHRERKFRYVLFAPMDPLPFSS